MSSKRESFCGRRKGVENVKYDRIHEKRKGDKDNYRKQCGEHGKESGEKKMTIIKIYSSGAASSSYSGSSSAL